MARVYIRPSCNSLDSCNSGVCGPRLTRIAVCVVQTLGLTNPEPQLPGAPTAEVPAAGVKKTLFWGEGETSTAIISRVSAYISAKRGGLRDLGVPS